MQSVPLKNSRSLFWSQCKISPALGSVIILSMEVKWVSFHGYIRWKIPGALSAHPPWSLETSALFLLPSCCWGNQVALCADGTHISLCAVSAVILPWGSNDTINLGSMQQPGGLNTCIGFKECPKSFQVLLTSGTVFMGSWGPMSKKLASIWALALAHRIQFTRFGILS